MTGNFLARQLLLRRGCGVVFVGWCVRRRIPFTFGRSVAASG